MVVDLTAFRSDLERFAGEAGVRAFGVADLDSLRQGQPDLLKRVGEGYSRAVVMGIRLQKAVLDSLEDAPTPLYFHHYRQTNYQLDTVAYLVADRIQAAAHNAVAIAASQIVEKDPMQGHISHRYLGWAAGIGYWGRNNLLVHPRYGSQMRYVSVLTDMALPADRPREGDCGDCRACIAVCPAGAITADRAEFRLDACFRKLTEFTRIPFVGQHICGVCVKACDGRNAGRRIAAWE